MRFDFPIFVMLAMLLSLPLTLILVHERLSLNFLKGSVDEIYVTSADLAVAKNERGCIQIHSTQPGVRVGFEGREYVLKNETFCFTPKRTAKITFVSGNRNLSLRITTTHSCVLAAPSNSLYKIVLDVPNTVRAKELFYVNATVFNLECKGGIREITFEVDRKLMARKLVYLEPKGNASVSLPLSLTKEGKHRLTVSFGNTAVTQKIEVSRSRFALFLPFTLLLFLLVIISAKSPEEFFGFILLNLTLIPLAIDMLGAGMFEGSFVIFFLSTVTFFLYRLLSPQARKFRFSGFTVAGLLILLFFTALPKFLFPTQDTMWNTFYERQAREAFYRDRVPQYDELSYLGRNMTYLPGYFALKSTFLRLFDADFSCASTILFEAFCNAALFFSLLSFFEALGFCERKSVAAALMFSSAVFVYILLSAHLLHVPSLALLFLALASHLKNESRIKTILLLSASGIIHAFSLVLFAVASVLFGAISRKRQRDFLKIFAKSIKLAVLITFLGGAITLMLYSRVLLANGMPYEIVPEKWGWLMKGSVSGLPVEFGMLLIPSVLVSLACLKRRQELLLCLTFILSLLFYLFVSFRINILVALLGCVILLRAFDYVNRNRALFLFAFSAANFVLSLALIPSNLGGYAEENLVKATEYLSALNYERVLVDPFYAHYVAFNANKKVLADLYVEYANESMYRDAERFARTGDVRIAEKWGINLILTYYDCGNYSRIYDNGVQKICVRY